MNLPQDILNILAGLAFQRRRLVAQRDLGRRARPGERPERRAKTCRASHH